ncbi:MAG: ATP-binding cassette domain-containing protein [Jatrophihabitantaceae bacterium]
MDTTGLPVRCVGLNHVYEVDGVSTVALIDVEFSVSEGEAVAVLGPSGSGKSTLLTVLAGLQRPTSGQVFLGADDVTVMSERELLDLRGRAVSIVVQNPTRNLLAYGTAEQNIRFARTGTPAHRRRRLPDPVELLRMLGLDSLAGQPVGRMSGGEQQRVSVALGMATAPGLLLADEPTSQLDTENSERVVRLLRRITAEFGTTVIAVTHDRTVGSALGRMITMSEGRADDHDQHVEQFTTIGNDGSVVLPADVRDRLPLGGRARIVRKAHGVELIGEPAEEGQL